MRCSRANSVSRSAPMTRRLSQRSRLTAAESDRTVRLARVYANAVEMIGDDEKAVEWLRTPNRALGGERPLDQLDTDVGAREVEDILGRIAFMASIADAVLEDMPAPVRRGGGHRRRRAIAAAAAGTIADYAWSTPQPLWRWRRSSVCQPRAKSPAQRPGLDRRRSPGRA